MANNRFTKNLSPAIPHLSRGEVADLRRDVYEALQGVAAEFLSCGPLFVKVELVAPAAGVMTAALTLSVLDCEGGDAINRAVVLELAAFDDESGVTPAVNATLDTATVGTILGGAGTAALKIKTSVTGTFACTLSDASLETVYALASASFGSPGLDCEEKASATFTAP
jgi:hypothetical protein